MEPEPPGARRRRLSRFGFERAPPPLRPVLFVNPRSGGGRAARAGVPDRARERGIEVVVLDQGQSLSALVDDAVKRGADALGIAGGDGSLSLVAEVAAAHDLPFICIPAGTRNHFALDVGIARHDVIGALDAFGKAVEQRVDVGEVNGRTFLNNVSLGIYGDAVRREAYRDAKLRTLLETAEAVVGPDGDRSGELTVVDDRGREHRHPGVLLVSNNPYALDRPVAPGTRPRLDSGKLGIVVIDPPPEGGPRPARAWSAERLEVTGPRAVHAGVDGEPADLSPPLEFTIHPAALRVRISPRHPGVSPSGLFTRGRAGRAHSPGSPPNSPDSRD